MQPIFDALFIFSYVQTHTHTQHAQLTHNTQLTQETHAIHIHTINPQMKSVFRPVLKINPDDQ